jgi:hypothetical protein
MISPNSVVDHIDGIVEAFAKAIDPLQKKLYIEVTNILKQLETDSSGDLKPNATNLRLVNKIKAILSNIIHDTTYQDNIVALQGSLDDVGELQKKYFSKVLDSAVPAGLLSTLQKQAFGDIVTSLTETGIGENVVLEAVKIVKNHILRGSSFDTMNQQMRNFLIGNPEEAEAPGIIGEGRLVSYSKQIVSDTLHQTSRNLNKIMSESLDFEWYMYVGALVQTSRPLCVALIEDVEFIHQSEFARICRGELPDGDLVEIDGMIPGTSSTNFVINAGGYNCSHQCIMIPTSMVPLDIQERIKPKSKK